MPLVRRTRATLRSAEFGFFGVVVNTRVHTPRRWGEPFSAGVFVFSALVSRPLRTSWAIVGTRVPSRENRGELRGTDSRRSGARARCPGAVGLPAVRARARGHRSQRNRVPAATPAHQPDHPTA